MLTHIKDSSNTLLISRIRDSGIFSLGVLLLDDLWLFAFGMGCLVPIPFQNSVSSFGREYEGHLDIWTWPRFCQLGRDGPFSFIQPSDVIRKCPSICRRVGSLRLWGSAIVAGGERAQAAYPDHA